MINLEAEMSVIGCLLNDGTLIKEITVRPEYFTTQSHRQILETMRSLEQKGIPVDIVSVTSEMGKSKLETIGGIEYLVRLSNSIPTTMNFIMYEKMVLEAWKLREAGMIASRLRDEVAVAVDSTIIGQTITELSKLEESGYEQDFNLMETIMLVMEQIETASSELSGVTTGFDDLNAYTNGLQSQDLIIVGARPSVGKTAFALNVGENAASAGTVVTIFSLEMSKESLLKRMLSANGRIDATKMRNAQKMFSDGDWAKLTMSVGQVSNLPLYIYDKPGITVQEIRAKVRKIKRRFPDKKHLVIIDYLQLIRGNGGNNRTLELGEISRSLKLMAREFDLPVVALSQLSRSLESRSDKRPMLSDLRESGSIEQDADVIMFLYRDDYYNAESEQKNIIEINIAKQRNGPTGKVELSFLKTINKFVGLDWGNSK